MPAKSANLEPQVLTLFAGLAIPSGCLTACETRAGTATYHGSRTGLPGLQDAQDEVGGWNDFPEVRRPAGWDADGDGVPTRGKPRGLDLRDPRDGAADRNADGYTNLEDYLNTLVGKSAP